VQAVICISKALVNISFTFVFLPNLRALRISSFADVMEVCYAH
jgi:hypothetical protein